MNKPFPRRLLVVALNFAPEITGIGKYVGEMTASLADRGFDIRVIAAPPYYPAWSVQPGYSAWKYAKERLSGAVVYRCPLLVPSRPRGLNRVIHLLSFVLSSFPVLLWQAMIWRPHVVFVVEPPLGCAPGARLAAWLGGARSWLHVQDFEIDAAFELGLLRAGWIRKLAAAAETWVMKRFDRVSSISERMLGKLHQKGVEPGRVAFFPNWVDTGLIHPLSGENALREELSIPADTAVMLYSGNMGEKQGLELLVEVARSFATTGNVLFLLCGDGAAKARTVAAAEGLANVRFISLQPLERLNELLNLADIHLLPQRADAEDLVMPSKLAAIMASGRPVVASARSGSDVARAAGEGGLVVPPGDAVAFGTAIETLLRNVSLRQQLGMNGRTCALKNWDRAAVMEKFAGDLEACMAQK